MFEYYLVLGYSLKLTVHFSEQIMSKDKIIFKYISVPNRGYSVYLCQMETTVYLTYFNLLSAILLQNKMLFFFQLNNERHSHESTKKRLFANEKQFKQLNRGN